MQNVHLFCTIHVCATLQFNYLWIVNWSINNAKDHFTYPWVIHFTVHVWLDELVQWIKFSKIQNQNRKNANVGPSKLRNYPTPMMGEIRQARGNQLLSRVTNDGHLKFWDYRTPIMGKIQQTTPTVKHHTVKPQSKTHSKIIQPNLAAKSCSQTSHQNLAGKHCSKTSQGYFYATIWLVTSKLPHIKLSINIKNSK